MSRIRSALAGAIAMLAATAAPAAAAIISGAGATFPAPIYAKWAETYRAQTGTSLNYQAIGSGGGIKQIKAGTVDFGASDKPLKPAELKAAGLYQFPTVVGGVVPIVNLPGVPAGRLRLTGPLLAAIFYGQVRRWDDVNIVRLNPGLKLPALPITVVHRSDGSGTTFLFTSYLARTSPAWGRKVGASDTVSWPVGLGGKGNDGVSAFVKQTSGAIGYVEYAYAKQNRATVALVRNRAGAFPAADAAAFGAAAAGADWAKATGNYLLLVDQPGAAAWPITGATFILIHSVQTNPVQGAAVLRFFDWAWKTGDVAAVQLAYVPLPAGVKSLVRRQWATAVTAGGRPAYSGR